MKRFLCFSNNFSCYFRDIVYEMCADWKVFKAV